MTIKKPGTPLFEPFLISFILDIKDVSVENPGAVPACLLFSESIDSLAASGAILSDIWTDTDMPTVDRLGQEFLDYVKDGMTISIKEDGLVEVE